MLGHLRSMLEESSREHFAIMRKVRLNRHGDPARAQTRFRYEANKQALQIEDLQRYSIHTHLIDGFDEVAGILAAIERAYYLHRVFVSGSAHECAGFGMERLRDLSAELGERIIENGLTLVNGMGLTIGESVVRGALFKLDQLGIRNIEKRLVIRPFPRERPGGPSQEDFNRRYREDMLRQCGAAVFIAGTSRSHRESAGVLEEYELSRALGKVAIPVGATGHAARKIWERIAPERESVFEGQVSAALFARLNDESLSNHALVDAVFEVLERVAAPETPGARPAPAARDEDGPRAWGPGEGAA